MKKYFFFDIDGTLIECNKGLYEISKTNRQSFDVLKEKGHDVFLATGRCKCFKKSSSGAQRDVIETGLNAESCNV